MKNIITNSNAKFASLTSENFLKLIGIEAEKYNKAVKNSQFSYRDHKILKKDGSYRPISVPQKGLKSIQRAVLDRFFNKISLSKCVYGLTKGKGIIENAKYHSNSHYLLNLDLKSFFPSVHFEKVKQVYKDIGLNNSLSNELCTLTTYEYRLPQGAPTSPFIASFVLNNLDYRLYNLAKENHILYTRYFDDLSFFGNKRVVTLEKDIIKIILNEGYKINTSKRQLFSKSETKEVNGILINNRKLSLKNTTDLLKYLSDLKKSDLSKLKSDNPYKEYQSLAGKVNFLKLVDAEKGKIAQDLLNSINW